VEQTVRRGLQLRASWKEEDFIREYQLAFVFALWRDDKINPRRLKSAGQL
jgi:hypothetical protein